MPSGLWWASCNITLISLACALTNERSRQKPSNGGSPPQPTDPPPRHPIAVSLALHTHCVLLGLCTLACAFLHTTHDPFGSPATATPSIFSLRHRRRRLQRVSPVLIHKGPLSLITISWPPPVYCCCLDTPRRRQLEQKTSHTLQHTRRDATGGKGLVGGQGLAGPQIYHNIRRRNSVSVINYLCDSENHNDNITCIWLHNTVYVYFMRVMSQG